MSYGELQKTDWENIITIRPGPTIHVWRGGADYCNIPLTHHAALTLIGSLVAAMQMAERHEVDPVVDLPKGKRAQNVLSYMAVTTPEELFRYARDFGISAENLHNVIPGCGPKTTREIMEWADRGQG